VSEQSLDGREILTSNIELCRERFPQLVGMDLQSSVGQPAFKNVCQALRGQLCPIALIDDRITWAPAGRRPELIGQFRTDRNDAALTALAADSPHDNLAAIKINVSPTQLGRKVSIALRQIVLGNSGTNPSATALAGNGQGWPTARPASRGRCGG